MKKNTSSFPLFFAFLLVATASLVNFSAKAQLSKDIYDSTFHHRNNIKLNITAWALYENPFVLSYERSVTKHQTFAITGGLIQFPSFGLLNLSNTKFESTSNKSGYTIGGEYRFYLARENKYAAPHGLYIGPYINYYHFNNSRGISFTDSSGNVSSADMGSKISVFNLGLQVGYQFVLWDRMTIDLVLFAPSISRYSADFTYAGTLNESDAGQISQEVIDALKNHFPLLNKLISEGSLNVNGNVNNKVSVWAPGLRYTLFIGYRFGK